MQGFKPQSIYPAATVLVLGLLFKEAFSFPVTRRSAETDVVCSETNPVNFPQCAGLTAPENHRQCYKVEECTDSQCVVFAERPQNANYVPLDMHANGRLRMLSPQRNPSRNPPKAYPLDTFCVFNVTIAQCQNKARIFINANEDPPRINSGDWLRLYATEHTHHDLDAEFENTYSRLYNAASFLVYFYSNYETAKGGFRFEVDCSDIPLVEAGSGGDIIPAEPITHPIVN